MNYERIFDLIQKGLTIAEALLEAGTVALPAIEAVKNIVSGAQKGEVTDEELTRVEGILDGMITEFNIEME